MVEGGLPPRLKKKERSVPQETRAHALHAFVRPYSGAVIHENACKLRGGNEEYPTSMKGGLPNTLFTPASACIFLSCLNEIANTVDGHIRAWRRLGEQSLKSNPGGFDKLGLFSCTPGAIQRPHTSRKKEKINNKNTTHPPPTMSVTPGGMPIPVTFPRLGSVKVFSREGGLVNGIAWTRVAM